MRIIKQGEEGFILEAFADAVKEGPYYSEIYVNPTLSELREVEKASQEMDGIGLIRFIATNEIDGGVVYVCPEYLLHYKVANLFHFEYLRSLPGLAVSIDRTTYAATDSTLLRELEAEKDKSELRAILDQDWSWVNQYIVVDHMLEKYEEYIHVR